MSLAKDKYREETNEDCYCEQWQVEGGSYKDEYVLWLEQQLVNKLNLPVVSGSASDFYTDLMKLINDYCDKGLKKPDLVNKMEYATESCKLS